MQLLGSFLVLAVTVCVLGVTWVFGDWKNWRKYYPTMLFYIVVDLAVDLLMSNHRLWLFHRTLFAPNHVIIDMLICFTNFAPMTLLYLSRYPYSARLFKQIRYISGWIVSFALIEGAFSLLKMISYHNGWNYWWSVMVWVFAFIGLRIHHTRPLWAWLLALCGTTFLILYFHIPVSRLG